jgi:hypothetical protein
MPATARLLQKLCSAANSELHQGKGGVLSQIVTSCIPGTVQQQQSSCNQLDDWAHSSRRFQHFLSREEQELLQSAAQYSSRNTALELSASSSNRSNSRGDLSEASRPVSSHPISASCDVPADHVLHDLYRNRQKHMETTGSNTALYKLPSRIDAGSVTADEFARKCSAEDHVLSRFYEEGVHGGLGRRFRRKVPLFQVGVVAIGALHRVSCKAGLHNHRRCGSWVVAGVQVVAQRQVPLLHVAVELCRETMTGCV